MRKRAWAGLAVVTAAVLLLGAAGGYKVRVFRENLAYHDMLALRDPTKSSPFLHRGDHFAHLPPDGPKVAMIGDSLTATAQWNELVDPAVANRGISGDSSAGVLARLDRSTPRSARAVFLMIGVNDLDDYQQTPEQVAANTAEIVRRLAPRRVVVQSVLLTRRPKLNERITALNALNRAACARGGCEYLDLNPAIAPTGRIDPKVTFDGLHINGEGYARWAAIVRPMMAKELAAR